MEKFHGKILKFSHKWSSEEQRKVLSQLPQRNDFVKSEAIGEEILFLPNYVTDMTRRVGKRIEYNVVCTGVRPNGQKIGVAIRGYKPFFDVRVPNDTEYSVFKTAIENVAQMNNVWGMTIVKHSAKICKGYDQHADFCRVSFDNLISRRKLYNYVKSKQIEYVNNKEKPVKTNVQLYTDDANFIYRAFSRQKRMRFCTWLKLSNYTVCSDLFQPDIPGFEIDFNDIQQIKQTPKELERDKSMEMVWDLETISYEPTGQAPDFNEMYDKQRREKNKIFMDSVSFFWYQEDKPLVTVNLTDMPVCASDSCLIVQVEDQFDIAYIKSYLFRRMRPDFVNGFNADGYDWPFLLNLIEETDKNTQYESAVKYLKSIDQYTEKNLNAFMNLVKAYQEALKNYNPNANHMVTFGKKCANTFDFIGKENCHKFTATLMKIGDIKSAQTFFRNQLSELATTPEVEKYMIKGRTKVDIKLEGGGENKSVIESHFYDAPGYVVIDTRTIFRKMYVTAEKSSLNFYLQKEKLELKEDMPYKRMFKIYIILKTLEKMYNTNDYNTIVELVSNSTESLDLQLYDFNKSYLDRASDFYIGQHSREDILALIKDAPLIVSYCNVDATRCHELIKKKCVIQDKREWANLSYVNFYDTVYYADGMKVRNVIMAEGSKPRFNLVFPVNLKTTKSEKKYKGAYVADPKKGIYKYHKYVKRVRRAAFRKIHGKKNFRDVLDIVRDPEFNRKYPLEEGELNNNDLNDLTDRPMGSADFSSLYPNEVIANNLSPEMVLTKEQARSLRDQGHKVLHTKFEYDLKEIPEAQRATVEADILQYTTDKDGNHEGMGLYPYILRKLYKKRSIVKGFMDPYESAKKVLEKFNLSGTIADVEKQLDDLIQGAFIKAEEMKKKFYYKIYENFKKIKTFIMSKFDPLVSAAKNYDDVVFYFGYYNSKQLSIKVFMNTFYGDTGNSTSPLFMVEVAGSITTCGREDILRIKAFAEKNGYRVLYGDTDSLYMTAPDHYYADLDLRYENGEISTMKYWEEMIELTDEIFTNFNKVINNYLYEINGTRYLKMDSEGVAFPYLLCGKKKYLMVKHIEVSKLDVCKEGTSVKDVMTCANLDIRGFEYKKRGASQFLREQFAGILRDLFSSENTTPLNELVHESLHNVKNSKLDNALFVKSAAYKKPRAGKPGNVAVVEFYNKLREIIRDNPNVGLTLPDPGDRFQYVIAKKYPYKYDLRGRKSEISAGSKYELFECIGNKNYEAILGEPIQVDVDYYIKGEIIGQFARLLTYHPTYDRFLDETEDFKKADKKAHDAARKDLTEYFTKHLKDTTTDTKGTEMKKLFGNVNDEYKMHMTHKLGAEKAKIINITNKVVTSAEMSGGEFKKKIDTTREIMKSIVDGANAEAKKTICPPDMLKFAKKKDVPLQHMYLRYVSKTGSSAVRLELYKKREQELVNDVEKLIQKYQVNLVNYRKILENTVAARANGKDYDYDFDDMNNDVLEELSAKYTKLYKCIRTRLEFEHVQKAIELEYNKSKKIVDAPQTINFKTLEENYMRWVNELS